MITDPATDPVGPLAVASAPLAALLSVDVGVVHRVENGLTQWDHPHLAPAYAQMCDPGPVLDRPHISRCGGMAPDLPTARLAALGEAVERYSASHLPRSRLRLAREHELDAPSAGPDWLDRAADRPATHWVPGHRLSAHGAAEPAWVAASRTYLADIDHDIEAMHSTSTGLACHPDPWTALASGLLEVVERDAVMLTWLPARPATPIRAALRWRTERGQELRFDRAIESYRLFALPSPAGITVVLGVATGGPGQPAVAVGAGAHLDPVRACRRALVETHQTFRWAEYLQAQGREPLPSGAPCHDFDDHVTYYLRRDRLGAFDFLLGTSADSAGALELDLDAVAPAPPAEQSARTIVGHLADAGFASFAVDVTSPDVRTAGLWVVRAVVPGMYPLIVGTTVRPDLPRLPAATPVNPDPHPFP